MVVANATIVPAGTHGEIEAYVDNLLRPPAEIAPEALFHLRQETQINSLNEAVIGANIQSLSKVSESGCPNNDDNAVIPQRKST